MTYCGPSGKRMQSVHSSQGMGIAFAGSMSGMATAIALVSREPKKKVFKKRVAVFAVCLGRGSCGIDRCRSSPGRGLEISLASGCEASGVPTQLLEVGDVETDSRVVGMVPQPSTVCGAGSGVESAWRRFDGR